MRITIDTKEDSYEDIKKVMHVLNHLIENKGTSPIMENKESVDTTNMMNMFGSSPVEEKPDTAPNFDALLNLGKKEEDKEPKVELF